MTKLTQDIITREAIYFWYYFSILFGQIFPYWILGITIGSLISVFGKNKIHHLFSNSSYLPMGLWGVIPAALLGMISPLCMYGTIPIAASFAQKGMRQDWLAAFMMSSVLINPQLMLYSAALGMPLLIIRILSCLICGITAGLFVHYFYQKKPFFNFDGFKEPVNRDTHPNIIIRFLKNIWRNIKTTGLYFLMGIILAALFQRYIPADSFAAIFGNTHKGFGLLMAATIGVPLYMCGGGTIPLLIAWLDYGMSYGAATAFMVTGPATKITNLGALKIVLGMKHFMLYILFVMTYALLCGFIVNLI